MPDNFKTKIGQLQEAADNEALKHKGGTFGNITTPFSPTQVGMERYLTYGAKTYGALGFDPTRDNNAFYNDHTSATADISRAIEGAIKIAKVGFTDTFAFGSLAPKSNSNAFNKAMQTYGSTRGGAAGFFSNTLLSSGYTAGIMAGIAAEEILLTAVTIGTGGLGSTAQGAESAALFSRLGSATNRAREINKSLDAVKAAADIKVARSFFRPLSGLNPLENTIEFVKGFDKMKDLTGLAKTVNGSAALVRDARKIYMTHSESKLEAELAQDEFFNNLYNKALDESNGKNLSEPELADIKARTKEVYDKIYTGNLGLIYSTNAITFDNMFKTMKGANRFFGETENGLFKKTIDKSTGKVFIEALEKPVSGFKRYAKQTIKDYSTLGGVTKKLLSNSMEGFQEVGQDVLSESVKSYYTDNKVVDQVKGGFLSNILDDIGVLTDGNFLYNYAGDAANDMLSTKGLETFLSGAVMGSFSSPVGMVTQGVNSFLFEGGYSELKNKIRNTDAYVKAKERGYATRKEQAEILTEAFNNTKNFVDMMEHPIFSQHESQEEMVEGSRNKDANQFKNAQEKSFAEGMHSILKTGMQDEFKEHIQYLATNLNDSEISELFARNDIDDDSVTNLRKKLKEKVLKVDQYKKAYDSINNEFANPIKLETLKSDDPQYLEQYYKYKAYESMKKDLLFSYGAVADRTSRNLELRAKLGEISKRPDALHIAQYYDGSSMDLSLSLLETEKDSYKGITDLSKQDKQKAKQLNEKYVKLKEYSDAAADYKKSLLSGNSSEIESAKERLQKAFDIQTKDEGLYSASVAKKEEVFNLISDYMKLDVEKGSHQNFIDALTGFDVRDSYVAKKAELIKNLDENKSEYISKALAEYDKKSVSDGMLQELRQEGLFFDLSELDDLLTSGLMPDVIYDVRKSQVATRDQKIKAQEIIKKHIANLKRLDLSSENKSSFDQLNKRYTSDKRTVSELLDQFGIKLNSSIDLSEKEGQLLLSKIVNSEFSFKADDVILSKFEDVVKTPVKLIFVNDQTSPIDVLDDGTISIDVRYAGNEFKASENSSLETLVVRALSQKLISESIKKIDNSVLNQVMNEIKQALPQLSDIPFLNDPELFLAEALNNIEFQSMLGDVKLSFTENDETAFSEIHDELRKLLSKDFSGNALLKIMSIFDNSFSEILSETIQEETSPETKTPVDTDLSVRYLKLYDQLKEARQKLGNKNLKRSERKKLQKELVSLGLEINDIQDQLDAAAVPEVELEKTNFESVVKSNAPEEYDRFGNELVSLNSSWVQFPAALKESFSDYLFDKSFDRLTREEVLEIMNELSENPVMQDMIVSFNDEITRESEIQNNELIFVQRKMKTGKQKVKSERGPKKSFKENITALFGEDVSLLSDNEINVLEQNLSSGKKESMIPFTMDDVRSYIASKKLKAGVKETKKELSKLATIRKNSNSVKGKKIRIPSSGKSKFTTIEIVPDLLNYLKTLEPEVFISEEDFQQKFEDLLKEYFTDSKLAIQRINALTKEANPVDVFSDLMKDNLLSPRVVSALNRKYAKHGDPLSVRKNRNLSGGLYALVPLPGRKARKISNSSNSIQSDLTAYLQNNGTNNETSYKIIAALGFENHKISQSLLETITKKNINSALKNKWRLVSPSGITSRDGFADIVSEDYLIENGSFDLNKDNVPYISDVLDDLVLEYNSPAAMLKAIHDELFGSENAYSVSDDELDYLNSEEGRSYMENLKTQNEVYYKSTEFAIEAGLFKGRVSELTDNQRDLYYRAVQNGIYPNLNVDELNVDLNEAKLELSDLLVSSEYIGSDPKAVERADELNLKIESLSESLNRLTNSDLIENDSFFDTNSTEVATAMVELMKTFPVDLYDSTRVILEKLNNLIIPFTEVMALARYINLISSYTEKQVGTMMSKITSVLKRSNFADQGVVVNGEYFSFQGIRGTEVLLKSADDKIQKISLASFVEGFENVAEEGQIIDKFTLDQTMESEQTVYAKSVFSEILNNFDNTGPEVSTEELQQQLIDHIKICK